MDPDRSLSRIDEKKSLGRLAAVALEQYGLTNIQLYLIKAWRGKHLLRVTSLGEDFILRLYVPPRSLWERKYRSEKVIRSQLLWQLALRCEAELPVQEPLLTSDGSITTFVSIPEASTPRICTLLRWIPGRTKALDELTPEDLHLIGSYIARMHQYAEEFSAFKGFTVPRWDWNYVFGEGSPLWHEGAGLFSKSDIQVLRTTAAHVRWDLQALGEASRVFGLIHRDLQPENLVFGNNTVSAIDFESCGWGYYLYDLAILLWRLEELGDHGNELEAALLQAYRQVRSLSEGDEEYIQTFLAMLRAEKIHAILRSKNESPSSKSERLSSSIAKLKEFTKSRKLRRRIRFFLSSWTHHVMRDAGRQWWPG